MTGIISIMILICLGLIVFATLHLIITKSLRFVIPGLISGLAILILAMVYMSIQI